MINWKEIIKSGVESVEIYSKDQVKVTCTNKDIGEEVFIAIRNNYQNLDAEPLKYIKGTNYKDFRFKFETSAEAALFLVALQNIIEGKDVKVPRTTARVVPTVTLLPTPVRTPVEKPSDDVEKPSDTVQTSSGSSDEGVVAAGETGTETGTETETEHAAVTGVEGKKTKINKNTIIIAAVVVALVLLAVVLLTKKRK